MPRRIAIYYAPAVTSALWQCAAAWLGRDAASGETEHSIMPDLPVEKLASITPSARRYGFHATLKAPMRLSGNKSRAELEAALTQFSIDHGPVEIGPVEICSLDGFLAIVPRNQQQEIVDFVQDCVEAFEPFRAPLSGMDRDKRAQGLTQRQVELLDQFGYPYVKEEFRFHMTLTNRLAPEDRQSVLEAARAWFAPVLPERLTLDRLVLFEEPQAGASFIRVADYPLSTQVAV